MCSEADEERKTGDASRERSKKPFIIRHSQIVLASERGQNTIDMAKTLGWDDQTVWNVIKGIN